MVGSYHLNKATPMGCGPGGQAGALTPAMIQAGVSALLIQADDPLGSWSLASLEALVEAVWPAMLQVARSENALG